MKYLKECFESTTHEDMRLERRVREITGDIDRDYPLKPPIRNQHNNKVLRTAYRYYGSVALLSQNPSRVDKNVDNLAIFILGK